MDLRGLLRAKMAAHLFHRRDVNMTSVRLRISILML
jgi:hypothetical protein